MANIPMKNYVKFLRGTPKAWIKLQVKDPDTLYFISETDEDEGLLYLGDKLIAGGGNKTISLRDLQDVIIKDLEVNSLLVYDNGAWSNKTITEIFKDELSDFSGATEDTNGAAGLVPIPAAGQQNHFLRGDGSWSLIEAQDKIFYDTVEGWNRKRDLVAEKGALYIYSNYKRDSLGNKIPGIKIGDGSSCLIDMPFFTDRYEEHIMNEQIHITQKERDNWNDKVTCFISNEREGLIVFTKEDMING